MTDRDRQVKENQKDICDDDTFLSFFDSRVKLKWNPPLREKLKIDPSYVKPIFRKIIEAYGGKCWCCGETEPRFLTMDHVWGRRNNDYQLKWGITYNDGGVNLAVKVKRAGYPKDGFRLACMNCNWASRKGNPCPHE